ncbi:MAG: V-type ATP synthase subunit F [Phycisphaerae bacterium]|jgi:vacuolar-type H+-ATPase subunit F/Vma7
MQGKVAILGSADFVMPYSALGVDCFTVDDKAEQIVQAAEKIIDEKYVLVIVSENMAPAAQEVFGRFVTKPVPCVLVVPFTTESKGFAIESLSRLLKHATGINILQNS